MLKRFLSHNYSNQIKSRCAEHNIASYFTASSTVVLIQPALHHLPSLRKPTRHFSIREATQL